MKKPKPTFKQTEIGPIPEDWELKTLKDMKMHIGDGNYSSKYPRQSEFIEEGVPFISAINLNGRKISREGLKYISREQHSFLTKGHVKSNDVLIVVRGNGVGNVALVQDEFNGSNLNAQLAFLRPEPDKLNPVYLYYLLSSRNYQKKLLDFSSGSAQPQLPIGHLEKLEIILPTLSTQRCIAEILSSLDDKIELNRKMNKTLEAIAQAIFKHWFVDFDFPNDKGNPYKSSGGKMVESEAGEVPEGWEITELGNILELAYGKALKEDKRENGNVPVYGSNGQVGFHNEKLVSGPGIVVGRKGNPGIVTWVQNDFFPIDTTFYVIPKKTCESICFLFHLLLTQDLGSLGSDSAVPGLNRNFVYMSKVVLPPKSLLDVFDRQIQTLNMIIKNNNDQNRGLSAIRDSLLPRLMSGRVRVKA